jgi:hypothetical protein
VLSFAEVLSRFPPAKKHGKEYRTVCPAHPDDARHPSLEIADGRTGVLFTCRTKGCSVADILKGAGLTWADVLPDRAPVSKNGDDFAAVYNYRDSAGVLRYQVVRKTTAAGKPKQFLQRHPNGSGDWSWKMDGIARLPYRLHELAGHSRVFVCEGEKDVDRLWSLGVPATCNTGGAKKWRDSDSAHVQAAGVLEVVICQDFDAEGAAHAGVVQSSAGKAGLGVTVLPPFPGVAPKGDVSDWLDLGHTVADLDALTVAAKPRDPFPLQFIIEVLDMTLTPPRWIVDGLLPAGGLNFLVAKPKVGKTTLARSLAVAIGQGTEWLGMACQKGEVWYLAYEGRLVDHRAHFIQLGVHRDDPIVLQEQSPLPGHLDAMFAKIRERHPTLVIIDHMQLALQIPKMNDIGIVTLTLQPFIEVSRETGTAFLFLAHARKGQQGGPEEDAIDALAGAGSFGGACDTYILLRKARGGATGSYRTIQTEQRIGDSLTPTILQFDKTSGLLRFAGDVALHRTQELVEELFTALEEANLHNERPTEAAWLARVQGRRDAKLAAKMTLLKAQRIIREGEGTKGDPFIYVVAAPSSGAMPVPASSHGREPALLTAEPAADDTIF